MPKGPLVEARPEAPPTASLLRAQMPALGPRTDHFSMGMIVVAAFGLFAFLYVLMLGRPVVRSDEAWLLWVAHRVAHGQPLYRDVYSVTTPLPIWIAAASVWLFGTHLMVVRALTTACFVASTLISYACVSRCGLGRIGRGMLVASLLVYASPIAHFASLYSQLAILFSLAALWMILRWLDEREQPAVRSVSGLLTGTGLLCAGSFDSKPNVGLLALAAVVTTVMVAGGRAGWRAALTDCRRVAASFVGGVAVVMIPIAMSGGFTNFLGDVFGDKPEYLRVMRDNFPPGVAQLDHVLSAGPSTIADRFIDTVPLAVGLAVVLLVWAWAHTPNVHRARMVALASFGFAAVVSAFPQPGPQHLTEIVPLLFTVSAGALAISRFGTPRGAGPTRIAVLVLVAWTAIGGVALVARAVLPAQGLGFGNSVLAHFEDTPRAPTDVRLRASLARLHRLTGGDVFIVRSDASYLYLGGGLRNPTRYDFPVRSDLGSSGQAGVVRDITRGSLRWVCLGHHARHRYDSLRPREIEHVVQRRMHLDERGWVCDLYGRAAHRSATLATNTGLR